MNIVDEVRIIKPDAVHVNVAFSMTALDMYCDKNEEYIALILSNGSYNMYNDLDGLGQAKEYVERIIKSNTLKHYSWILIGKGRITIGDGL